MLELVFGILPGANPASSTTRRPESGGLGDMIARQEVLNECNAGSRDGTTLGELMRVQSSQPSYIDRYHIYIFILVTLSPSHGPAKKCAG